jgi:Zn-dependent protease with chaperone function
VFVALFGFLDWAIAPAVVTWVIPATELQHDGDRYITSELVGALVARRCQVADMPLVRLAIVEDGTPNAFAFGHARRDARVYVTRGLLHCLDEDELDAVIAHELGHVRHLDFVLMSMAMLVPLALYAIGRALIEADDDDDDEGGTALFGIAVLALWIVSEFVVVWLSRTRELAADHWSCESTGNGDALVSALVKVGYGMTVQQRADAGAKRKKEKGSSRDFATDRVRTLGIFDQGAAGAMANGFIGGLDVERAVAAVRWEGRNPWARVLETTSTHPLVGRRIATLQASDLPGRPKWLGLDAAAAVGVGVEANRQLRLAFAADIAVLLVPWAALVTAVVLLLNAPATWEVGLLLVGAGVAFAIEQCRRYPFPARGVEQVTSLLQRMDASPVRGIAVEARGRIVGRDTPGYLFASDVVLQDDSGVVALDYRQPVPFADALFGFAKAKSFVGEDVVVRGWYRRTPEPVIELRDLRTADGRKVRPYLWLARFFAAGPIVVAGLAVMTAQLATIGGA